MFAVDHRNAGSRRFAEQLNQRLEVEVRVDVETSLRQMGRQIELAPKIILAAGKDGLGMRSVAAQLAADRGDAVQVGAQTMVMIALATLLMRIHGLADQVFEQNMFF